MWPESVRASKHLTRRFRRQATPFVPLTQTMAASCSRDEDPTAVRKSLWTNVNSQWVELAAACLVLLVADDLNGANEVHTALTVISSKNKLLTHSWILQQRTGECLADAFCVLLLPVLCVGRFLVALLAPWNLQFKIENIGSGRRAAMWQCPRPATRGIF